MAPCIQPINYQRMPSDHISPSFVSNTVQLLSALGQHFGRDLTITWVGYRFMKAGDIPQNGYQRPGNEKGIPGITQ